jgi:methyl-accepting chemotaxis protein
MDKVTQSNAGNAEETAAAAEELSSQAVAMRENVNELMKLVGGAQTEAAGTASHATIKASGATSATGASRLGESRQGVHHPAAESLHKPSTDPSIRRQSDLFFKDVP